MPRITVSLTADETRALQRLAAGERRHSHQQAALMLRRSLERLGLLQNETAPTVETLAGDTVRAAHSEPIGSESAPLEGAQP